MASISFPRPDYNGGIITESEHERLTFVSHAEGLFGWPGDPAPVFADSSLVRTVKVRAGIAGWVRGSRWESGATDITLQQLAANTSGQPRIDLVVLRLDRADYTVTEVVITGTPAANPSAPARQSSTGTTGFYDFPLAEVRVNSGDTNLQASAVTTRAWYIGSDGQIRCTPDSRPPREAGRVAWEHPTGRYIVSSGDVWVPVYDDSGPTSIGLSSGYKANLNKVQRRNGLVVLSLEVYRTTTLAGGVGAVRPVKVGQLPVGFYPTFETPGSVQFESSAGLSMGLRVTTVGGVYVDVPSSMGWSADRPVSGSLVFHAA